MFRWQFCLPISLTIPQTSEHTPAAQDDCEIPETAFKLVFCGPENHSFELFDFGFKKSTYRSPVPESPSSLTSINYSDSHHLLTTGSSSGIITIYDTRSIRIPLTSFSRLETVIEDLAFIYSKKFRRRLGYCHCRWTPISSECGPRKTCR